MSKTNNYIINRNKILGIGATAKVYSGIKLADGSQFAIKCSKRDVKDARKILEDEWNFVKDLDNKHIIQFYEFIPNFQRFDCVIIMEYLNKGSLYEFTELHQGLCDNMFLKVLECLYQGLLYLREKGITHRDIKPGNMMVHQDHMGYYNVKIVDLGTAKRVAEGKQFKTICGTLEYLHPDMFIQHLGGLAKEHNTTVDLWSSGVTLYYAAINALPFQPRDDIKSEFVYHEQLKYMYVNKKPGAISCKQINKRAEDIVWSDQLPDDCRMSPMLRSMATALISDLLDLGEENTFERFYKHANDLGQRKRILVFNSVTGELLILYLAALTYDNIVQQVSQSVGLPSEDFIIMTKNKILTPTADPQAECLRPLPVKGHLKYELNDDTLLVFAKKLDPGKKTLLSRQLNDSKCESPKDSISFHFAKRYSETLLRSIYQMGYSANYIDCQRDCYLATMFAFNQYVLVDDLRLMHEVLPWQIAALQSSCTMTTSLMDLATSIVSNLHTLTDIIAHCKEEIPKAQKMATDQQHAIDQYYDKLVNNREMFKFMEEQFYRDNDNVANDKLDFLVHLSEELVNEMKILPEEKLDNDENVYKLEIWERHVRLYSYYNISKDIFQRKIDRISEVHKYFYDRLKIGLSVMNNITAWKEHIVKVETRRQSITSKFMDMISGWREAVNCEEGGALKTRIHEIKKLTDLLKDRAV